MLERYVQLRSPDSKALNDLKKTDIDIIREEATAIQNIVSALLLVKITAMKLGNCDLTHLSSEAEFQFIFKELSPIVPIGIVCPARFNLKTYGIRLVYIDFYFHF